MPDWEAEKRQRSGKMIASPIFNLTGYVMGKKLSEMSLEELWQLFPIFLTEHQISFNKGYTENGFAERVFHLHVKYAGDNDELYFRDYLIGYTAEAKMLYEGR